MLRESSSGSRGCHMTLISSGAGRLTKKTSVISIPCEQYSIAAVEYPENPKIAWYRLLSNYLILLILLYCCGCQLVRRVSAQQEEVFLLTAVLLYS